MHFTKGELLKGCLSLFDFSNHVKTSLTVFLVLGVHQKTGDYIIYDVRDMDNKQLGAFYEISSELFTDNAKERLYYEASETSYVYIELQGYYIDIPVSYNEINMSNNITIYEQISKVKKKIYNLALDKTGDIYLDAWL